jgi:hypothetical protein
LTPEGRLDVAERKGFLLRLPPALLDEINRWAAEDLRSVNAQIEFLLREAVRRRRKEFEDDNEIDRAPL